MKTYNRLSAQTFSHKSLLIPIALQCLAITCNLQIAVTVKVNGV